MGCTLTHLLAQSEAMGADCGCLWEGSFSEVAPAADLIVIGEVRSIKGNAVDLVPEQVLKGAFWLDTLRVWMQTRDYCRPPATHFPAGSRWIMALSEIREVPEDGFNPSTPNQSFGRPFDYYALKLRRLLAEGPGQNRNRQSGARHAALLSRAGYVTRFGGPGGRGISKARYQVMCSQKPAASALKQ